MVDQLNRFAGEVTRVAREVGTEGRLGGQANVIGVAGTWKDLTESVNSMASNLTAQVRNIAEVSTAVANGDLSKKITVNVSGEILQLKDTINTMVDQLSAFAARSDARGPRSRRGRQARRPGAGVRSAGTWKDLTDSVNWMASNLPDRCVTSPGSRPRSPAETFAARSRSTCEAKFSNSRTRSTRWWISSAFASEVTRVAREVGTEGNSAARRR